MNTHKKMIPMRKTSFLAAALLGLFVAACGNKGFQTVEVAQFKEAIKNPSVVLVDVRTPQEFAQGHIDNALNIDVKDAQFIENIKGAIPKESKVAVYCRSGKRSADAAQQLEAQGYEVLNLDGGITAWNEYRHKRDYVIVIHGGAGNIASVEKDSVKAATYYAALDSALRIGGNVLDNGGKGPEAVIAVINYLENNPLFNAGKGATITDEGTFELDACIMEGKDLSAGAVAGIKTVKNPINAAYAVKTKSEHVLLAGEGADAFAAAQGLEIVDNSYFVSPKTMKWVAELSKKSKKNGTVGCVILDTDGNLTAGTSTGGRFRKQWGRIGDAPIVGAGTYADNNSCAVSCTGHGEYYIRHAVAFNLSARYKYLGESLEEAAKYIIHTELNSEAGNGGLVSVDKDGNIAMEFNSTGMYRGFLYKNEGTEGVVCKVGIGEKLK